jgi:hypothetical protein
LAGELIGLIAMHYLARIAFQGVGRYNIIAITGVSAMLGIVSAIVGLMPPGRNLPANLALLVICAAAMFLSLLRFVPSFARVGFSGFAAPTQPPPP